MQEQLTTVIWKSFQRGVHINWMNSKYFIHLPELTYYKFYFSEKYWQHSKKIYSAFSPSPYIIQPNSKEYFFSAMHMKLSRLSQKIFSGKGRTFQKTVSSEESTTQSFCCFLTCLCFMDGKDKKQWNDQWDLVVAKSTINTSFAAFPLQSGLEFLKLAGETAGSNVRLHCAIVQNDLIISPDLSVLMPWVILNICLSHQYLATLSSVASFLLPLIFPSITVWFYFIYDWMICSCSPKCSQPFLQHHSSKSSFIFVQPFWFHKYILGLGRSKPWLYTRYISAFQSFIYICHSPFPKWQILPFHGFSYYFCEFLSLGSWVCYYLNFFSAYLH